MTRLYWRIVSVTVVAAMVMAFFVVHARVAGRPPAASAQSPLQEKIKHIVIIMQENRSFDTYFGAYPGADGLPSGVCLPNHLAGGPCVAPWHDSADINFGASHTMSASLQAVDNGRMDGFVDVAQQDCALPSGPMNSESLNPACPNSTPPGNGQFDVMGYKTGADIPNYWSYARHFVLQDHMFEPVASYSLPAHLFLVSNWSALCPITTDPMSCHTEPMSPTALYDFTPNPPPNQRRPYYAWTDITYLLHNAGVSWGYYIGNGPPADCPYGALTCSPPPTGPNGTVELWNPLPYFNTVHDDKQGGNVQPVSQFFPAAAGITATLPAVSWIVPSQQNSEHPPYRVSVGQAYVTQLINAIMQSNYWSSTAILLAWDDWGGFYDHVPPTLIDGSGYGMRVPGLVISPYANAGTIDHQTLSFDAYNKFIEDVFLGGQRLDPRTDGRPDPRPNVRENLVPGDLINDFNFNQTPIPPLILTPYPPTATATPLPSSTPLPPATTTPPPAPPPPAPSSTSVAPPTPAPSPPAGTAAPAAATARPAPPASGLPAATTTPAPHSDGAPPTAPPLSLNLSAGPIVTGQTLTVQGHTAARAQVTGTLQVTASHTTFTGSGKQRKKVTHTTVRYTVTWHGAADAHGRFTAHLRVTYKPATPAQAALTVTARTGHTSSTRAAHLIIQAIPLSASARPSSVVSGDGFTLRVQTAARAHISMLLQVLTSRLVDSGRGKHHSKVHRTIVLYQVTLQGKADTHGRFAGRVHITYTPHTPARAGVTVTARATAGAASSDLHVTIRPRHT